MTDSLHELDHRRNDGIDVWLRWRERDNAVLVVVADQRTGQHFEIEVREGDRPLDVFNHPYAYAASRGIEARADVAARTASLI